MFHRRKLISAVSSITQFRMALVASAFFAGVVGSPEEVFSQDLDYRGVATARVAVETNTGELQLSELLIEPEVSGSLGDKIDITVVGRLRFDPADEIEPGNPMSQSDIRSAVNRRLFIGDVLDFELREAFADIHLGDWFLRLGKQQVVWGQADGLRVLDQVNPLSFREFILGDFEDRRIPLWTVNAERTFGPVTVQLLWIPDHTFNEIPDDGTCLLYTSPSPRDRTRSRMPSSA